MSQHWPGDDSGPCLVTTYWRTVFVCDKDDGSLCPSHSWFHAMLPDSYSRPLGQELPRCEIKKCMNYYNRPGTYHCLLEPAFMFSPCVCRPLPTYRTRRHSLIRHVRDIKERGEQLAFRGKPKVVSGAV
jgi:hypothetical protein